MLFFGCKTQLVERGLKFTITSTEDYCGGAYPPEELLAQLKTPKAFNGTLYIHKTSDRSDDGIAIILKEGTANQSGFVEGKYFIFREMKVNMEELHKPKEEEEEERTVNGLPPRDIGCIIMKNHLIIGQFTITNETKEVTQNINLVCDPCGEPKP